MSVLSDKEIREFAEKGMITPFQSSLINKENDILSSVMDLVPMVMTFVCHLISVFYSVVSPTECVTLKTLILKF